MRRTLLKKAGILAALLLAVLAVYKTGPFTSAKAAEPEPAILAVTGSSSAEEPVTQITLTKDNWLDFFTVDCRERITTTFTDISSTIYLEYRIVPRKAYADRLIYDGSVLQFDVNYNKNFGIFPIDRKSGHILDDSTYSTVVSKTAGVTMNLEMQENAGIIPIDTSAVIWTDDDSGIGEVCTSFEVTAAEGSFRVRGTELPTLSAAEPDVAASGIAGCVRWKLDREGLLTVYGEGKMSARSGGNSWKEHLNDIRRVVIEDGVTNVDLSAFRDAENLEEVSFGNTVGIISESPFFSCPKLQYVYIPASVQSIGEQAFAADERLSIISVDPNNSYYMSTGRTIYDKDKTTLICCVGNVPAFRIPEGVTKIASCAFRYHSKLRQVELPNTLTSIDDSAFDHCTGLKSVIYHGTREEWERVSVDRYNEALTSSDVICMEKGNQK